MGLSSDGKQLVIRVPAEMKEALSSMAATNERTIAQEVRLALRQYIEREEEAHGSNGDHRPEQSDQG